MSGTTLRSSYIDVANVQANQFVISCVPASYFQWKDWVGRFIALFLLIPFLPVIGLAMLIVRLTSPGPAIYRQARMGKDGVVFDILKIRSMRNDAEKETGAVWSTSNDARVTPVGKLFRRLHIDELPQLINVLKGEMALIGPRPERPEIVQDLTRKIPGYLNRLGIRPGITGLAQLNLPPDSSLDSVKEKLELDLIYVRNGNAWMDIMILFCTGLRILGIKGQRVVSCFGIYYQPQRPWASVAWETSSLDHTHPDEPSSAPSAKRKQLNQKVS